ncbi:related to NADPH quinone oxidoreductase homolog PIG3 [Phialocephala subalpina]|uniref:Related to NADPH quinone oxidoreductase homolog PIG3 n=1 Tax=Phialocephala subalpina TaxID=576137 RepID=A0A1L7XVW3_9HELO|nr:related to NADPH quinone oxidoreductase homolog PIG3 [Phialocephala subalpina]
MAERMQAITIPRFGGPEVLTNATVPKPTPVDGEVLIHVKAFGVNHAEMHMRKGEWDEWNPISGLECVGTVTACPDNTIPIGTKVAGVMGGMGRNRPGGYGEFVNVPVSNVIPLETNLPWEELAALPEVYCTAWSCVHTVLDANKGETLLIRGATSTIGQAALNLAVNAGAKVTATTRRSERFEMLKKMGVVDAVLEQSDLGKVLTNGQRFDKVLNLIGNRVLLESISLTRPGGRMLQAGWLGGLAPVKDFNPMVEMESGVHFSLFHSKVLGTQDFPLSNIPLQEIVKNIENGEWDAKPAFVFEFKDIQEAHKVLDSHDAGGKIVVRH